MPNERTCSTSGAITSAARRGSLYQPAGEAGTCATERTDVRLGGHVPRTVELPARVDPVIQIILTVDPPYCHPPVSPKDSEKNAWSPAMFSTSHHPPFTLMLQGKPGLIWSAGVAAEAAPAPTNPTLAVKAIPAANTATRRNIVASSFVRVAPSVSPEGERSCHRSTCVIIHEIGGDHRGEKFRTRNGGSVAPPSLLSVAGKELPEANISAATVSPAARRAVDVQVDRDRPTAVVMKLDV